MMKQLAVSVTIGIVLALIMAVTLDTRGHSALVASARAGHESPTALLLTGFIGWALIIAVVLFAAMVVIASMARRARKGRARRIGGPGSFGGYGGEL